MLSKNPLNLDVIELGGHGLARLSGRDRPTLLVVFCEREDGEIVRIISARKASPKEANANGEFVSKQTVELLKEIEAS